MLGIFLSAVPGFRAGSAARASTSFSRLTGFLLVCIGVPVRRFRACADFLAGAWFRLFIHPNVDYREDLGDIMSNTDSNMTFSAMPVLAQTYWGVRTLRSDRELSDHRQAGSAATRSWYGRWRADQTGGALHGNWDSSVRRAQTPSLPPAREDRWRQAAQQFVVDVIRRRRCLDQHECQNEVDAIGTGTARARRATTPPAHRSIRGTCRRAPTIVYPTALRVAYAF